MLDEEGIRRVGSLPDIHKEYVEKFFEKSLQWKWHAQRLLKVDVDSHVKKVCGKEQGAARGYKPRKRARLSYHLLVAMISELWMPFEGLFRPGDTNGKAELVELFKIVKGALSRRGLSPRVIQFVGDAGIACEELLAEWESIGNVRYGFSVAINKAFKDKLCGLRYTNRLTPGISVWEF